MAEIKAEEGLSPTPREPIRFHYIKSNGFRVVHVDGAIGSLTPRGLIHAALYSERIPIPRMVAQSVAQDGSLGSPVEQEVRQGVVREVEVSLLLDRHAAEAFRNWLSEQIAEFDRALAAAKAAKTESETP